MIPLHSTVPLRHTPWANYALLGANVGLFAYELTLGDQLPLFLHDYGWVPVSFSFALQHGEMPVVTPLLVSMFLHGGWLHLLGNLLFLLIFGGNVEDRLGRVRYVLFYVLGGGIAILVQTYMAPGSSTPMIGASGAIAAVMGAYLVFSPRARVLTLIPLIISYRVVQVPAVYCLLVWLCIQVGAGLYLGTPQEYELNGVAWWAHVGGFGAGMLLGPLLLHCGRRPRGFHAYPPLVWQNSDSVLRWK